MTVKEITKDEIVKITEDTMKNEYNYNEDEYSIVNIGCTDFEKSKNVIHVNVGTNDLKHVNILISHSILKKENNE